MTLDYGFDKSGGFYVLDHAQRRAAYAYPTSTHATNAKRSAPAVATAMAAEFGLLPPGYSADMAEQHYVTVLECSRRDKEPSTFVDGRGQAIPYPCIDDGRTGGQWVLHGW